VAPRSHVFRHGGEVPAHPGRTHRHARTARKTDKSCPGKLRIHEGFRRGHPLKRSPSAWTDGFRQYVVIEKDSCPFSRAAPGARSTTCCPFRRECARPESPVASTVTWPTSARERACRVHDRRMPPDPPPPPRRSLGCIQHHQFVFDKVFIELNNRLCFTVLLYIINDFRRARTRHRTQSIPEGDRPTAKRGP
jgi:hypothetical protein